MIELIEICKNLVILLGLVFAGSILLYFISHIFMGIYKTLFCDVQVKLYRIWRKRLKKVLSDEEVEKVLKQMGY